MSNPIGRLAVSLLVALSLAMSAAFGADEAATKKAITWEPIGLSGGGSMYRPSFSPLDPKFLMINSDMSDVFISRDGGLTWEMIHQSQLYSSTYCYPGYHPTDANVIFAAQGGSGMKVTRDKGVTWKQVEGFPRQPLKEGQTETFPRNLRGEIRLDPDSPDRMIAGDEAEVFISLDGGKTWKPCEGVKGVTLAFHFDRTSPVDKRVIYAGTSEGVWRSEDGGVSWKPLPLPAEGRKLASFTGGSNAKDKTVMLYASVDTKGGEPVGALYRSADAGKTWQSIINNSIAKGSKTMQFPYVFTTDLNPKIVVAFNVGLGKYPMDNGVWRSDDAGDTWRCVLSMDYHEKWLNVTGHDYWSRAYGQYWTWEPRGVGFDYANPDRLMRSQSNLIITEDSKKWRYANTSMAKDGDPKKGPLPTWICNGLVVTTTWNYYVDPFKPERRYIGYTDIGFAISDDHDKTWEFVQPRVPSGPNGGSNTTYELAFEPKTEGKIWGAFSGTHDIPGGNIIQGGPNVGEYGGNVSVSTDHGETWTMSNKGLPDKGVISIVMDPKSPVGNRTLYCSVWKNGVYKSVDDGQTWAKASDGLGDAAHPEHMYPCKIVLHPDGTLFVLLTGRKIENRYYIEKGPGIYKSTDGAKTWELVNKSQFWPWPQDVTADPKDSKILYVGTSNAKEVKGGLFRTTDGGATWTQILEGPHFGAYLHPNRPGWIYATQGGLWLSKADGKTFKLQKGPSFTGTTRVMVDPADDDVIYVSTFGGSVWRGPASD